MKSSKVQKSLVQQFVAPEYMNLYLSLLTIYILIALCSVLTSTMDDVFRGNEVSLVTIIHVSFFYITPLIVWIFLMPVVGYLSSRYSLLKMKSLKRHLAIHFIIALIAAPLIRILSLILDFSLKSAFGLIKVPAWEVIVDVWYVAITTAPRAFYTYWLILLSFSLWFAFLIKKKEGKTIKKASKKFLRKKEISVQDGNKILILNLRKVFWISVNGNYIQLHTQEGVFRRRETLSSFESQVDPGIFFRIHRSTLVNKEAIESWQHWRRGEYLIRLKNEKCVTSSRGYRENMQRLIHSFQANQPL